jgi:hypothetical protein
MLTATDERGEKVVRPTSPSVTSLLEAISSADDRIVKLFGLAEHRRKR